MHRAVVVEGVDESLGRFGRIDACQIHGDMLAYLTADHRSASAATPW